MLRLFRGTVEHTVYFLAEDSTSVSRLESLAKDYTREEDLPLVDVALTNVSVWDIEILDRERPEVSRYLDGWNWVYGISYDARSGASIGNPDWDVEG